jgi:hypothetical protein
MTKVTLLLLGPIIVLLPICIYFFDGRMAPAVWQLLSAVWVGILTMVYL